MTDEKVPNPEDQNVDNESNDQAEGSEQPDISVGTTDENSEQSETPQDAAADSGDAVAADSSDEQPDNDSAVVNEDDASEDDAEAEMLKMLEDLPDEEGVTKPEDIDFGSEHEVSEAQFQHLSEPATKSKPRNIEMLMDVNLPVAIELGRTKMSINDILALGPGSVVELHKLAGEPVDVLVNNKAIARGEVVVIDENFGVRVTQLLTPEERLKSINEQHG